jgi:predicted transporter
LGVRYHDGVPRLAWSEVVYSVLNPVKITIHMIVALLIVALLIYLIKKTSGNNDNLKEYCFQTSCSLDFDFCPNCFDASTSVR